MLNDKKFLSRRFAMNFFEPTKQLKDIFGGF
jgi:hypothetical protein